MVEAILGGEPGARRDVVLLNAGAALLVAGAVGQLEEGIDKAALTIDAGVGDGAPRGAARRPAPRRGRGRRAGRARRAPTRRRRGRRHDARRAAAGREPERRPRDRGPAARRGAAGARRARGRGARPGGRGRAGAARPIVDALAAPGLHLIAEVKRRSPSAGAIVEADDAVARARAYAAGGAAAISVLCEPHWFGGSVDDLRAVRAAVSVPVLAKEFVVDPRQLDLLRAAGADLVLLLAVLHPAKRLARLVGAGAGPRPGAARRGARRPRAGGRRSRRARGSSASTTATCGRSTSTRSAPSGCASSSPATGSPSPSPASGTRGRSPAGARPGSTPRSSARR